MKESVREIRHETYWIDFDEILYFGHAYCTTQIMLTTSNLQLDATLCRFYFCRVTLHVSGVKRPSSGVFKTSTTSKTRLGFVVLYVFGVFTMSCGQSPAGLAYVLAST